MTDFDFSELTKLVSDLGAVEHKVIPLVRNVVEASAEAIRDDWREDAAQNTTLKKYKKTMFVKMRLDADGSIGADIQPRRGGEGNFASVLELGGSNKQGIANAPQNSGRKALAKNRDGFEKDLLKAAGDVLDA